MYTSINEFRKSLITESVEPGQENTVLVVSAGKSLANDDKMELQNHARLTNGLWKELDVSTATDKIFVAGPKSFFDWYDRVEGEYGDPFELFYDASVIYDEDGNELDEVLSFYMNNDELWVTTDKSGSMSYKDWYNSIN